MDPFLVVIAAVMAAGTGRDYLRHRRERARREALDRAVHTLNSVLR